MFVCWLVRPGLDFRPTVWTDNPDEATAMLALPEPDAQLTADEANQIARGFNESEMAAREGKPTRMWMLVLAADNTTKAGDELTVYSFANLN